MNELHLQDKFLIPFFTTNHGIGLGYREVKPNTVTNNLIIEADLLEFLKDTELNKENYQKLLKKYNKDEKKLIKEFVSFVEDKMKNPRNMAIFINQNKTVTFEGLKFHLFYVSETEIYGDKLFGENIFSVVQELPYRCDYEGKKLFAFRPDLSFFVNGIYLGYSELKSNYKNQNAKKNGRGKVIKDYREACFAFFEHIEFNEFLNESEIFELRKEYLKIFEKAIHISTTDISDTYFIRQIGNYFDDLKNIYSSGKLDFEEYRKKVESEFKPYPLSNNDMEKVDKLDEIFKAHYSKTMIEKEILYYNFIEKEVVVKDKKKELKNERGKLISPRPKQKFGVDKIMARIDEFLEHEGEDDYFINKLRKQLKGVSKDIADDLIAKRLTYQNNKNTYSLLLQYAAGFGKSNIIGWSALQLKDLKKENTYVYDKIMIIVDRVQLRDQLDTKMFNMNIDNKMYIEAKDKKSFQKALSSDIRIVIVNLQKFNEIRNILDSDVLEKLAKLRIVFLIDEIHRSNSGLQHEEMISLFDVLQDSFDKDESYNKNREKKNLIVGFTATPSDNTLSRFGEFSGYAESEKIWIPFDSYTMKEAIKDGFVLNPLTGIVPISARMYYEMPDEETEGVEDLSKKEYKLPGNQKVYENEERIEAISEYVARLLVQDVYKKIPVRGIGGTAKAMLAVYSIKSAIKYKEYVTEYFNKYVQDKKYEKYKEAPIYIVFSSNQDDVKASTLNGGLGEEKVLQNFAVKKNGLIIVVDKLQTGFDEPKLHTLFLDKEINGINAIQTISRVNRKAKGKNDCKIVDFSYRNVNVNNIKNAFEHFSDVVVSDFDPHGELKLLEYLNEVLKQEFIYEKYFEFFVEIHKDIEVNVHKFLSLEQNFENYIKGNQKNSEKLKKSIGKYFKILNIIDFVISFDKKYKEELFLDFFRKFNTIYNMVNKSDDIKDDVEVYFDNQIGIVEPPEFKEKKNKTSTSGGDGNSEGSKHKYNILDLIEQKNEEEEAIGELIEEFEKKIDMFFDYIQEQKEGANLIAKIKSGFDENEIYEDFEKVYKKFVRRKKKELGEFFITETKSIVEKLCDDFESYLKEKERFNSNNSEYKPDSFGGGMAAEPKSEYGK